MHPIDGPHLAEVPLRILLVDDEELVRTGLRLILEGDTRIRVTAEAASGEEAVTLTRELDFDVVLMDIRMSGISGIEATRQILQHSPHLAVVLLTAFDAHDFIVEGLQAGARGFLLKSSSPQVLISSVFNSAAGGTPLTKAVVSKLVGTTQTESASTESASHGGGEEVLELHGLTAREREVAELVVSGLNNAQIAEELFISVATVKTHIAHIYDKLQVNSRVQLAHFFHTNN